MRIKNKLLVYDCGKIIIASYCNKKEYKTVIGEVFVNKDYVFHLVNANEEVIAKESVDKMIVKIIQIHKKETKTTKPVTVKSVVRYKRNH